MQYKDRLGSYPCVPLRCILASDREKIAKILNYKCLRFAKLTQRKTLRRIVNRP
jgi:hypothetical protein